MRMDSPGYRALGYLTDAALVTGLWLVACLPVVTVPAATVALFTVARARQRGEGPGGVRAFAAALRHGFRRSTVVGWVWLAVGGVLGVDLVAVGRLPDPAGLVLAGLLAAVGVTYLVATPYLLVALAYARPAAVREAVLAATGNPGTTVRCALVLVAAGTAVLVLPAGLLVVPMLTAGALLRLCGPALRPEAA